MDKILAGKKIVLTRAKDQSKESLESFSRYGADVIALPCIKVVAVEDYSEFDSTIANTEFDYLIYPSTNAVEMMQNIIKKTSGKLSVDNSIKIALGAKTMSKCESAGIKIDMVPEKFSARGVLEMLEKEDLKGKHIMLPTSTIARTELGDGLREMGAVVHILPVYDIVCPDKQEVKIELEYINNNTPDLFVFTSPSTFENCLKIMEISNPVEYFEGILIAAIGSTTKEFIEQSGLKVNIVPGSYTMNALLDEIITYYKTDKIGE